MKVNLKNRKLFDYVFDNVYMYDIKYKLPLGEQCNLL